MMTFTVAKNNSQGDGCAEEPLFSWRILGALVNLFPERQVIIGPSVKIRVERYARHPVEHEVGNLGLSVSQQDKDRVEAALTVR